MKISHFLAILTMVVSTGPARAASVFNLSFFDNSGNQVGTGTFTDTENTVPVCFPTSNDPNACSGQPWAGPHVDVTHVVDNFSVYFPGEGGGLSGGTQWYYDPSTGQEPGSIYSDRYGPHATYGFVFQQNSEIIENFGMGFSQATPTLATGSWNYTIQAKYGSFFYSGSGTFIATSVPEPLNVLGASIGLGLILRLKRKSP
jgi:hypothetical protein